MINGIYAKSLIEFGDNFLEQLKQIDEVLKSSKDLRTVLVNPSINIEIKKDILQSVFEGKIDARLINFLKILCEKSRIEDFKDIVTSYEQMLDENNNVKFVEVISAIDLSDEYKHVIQDKLEKKLKASIHSKWTVEPKIIGGLVLKFDDTIADLSLRKKIENLSKIMK